MPNMLDNPFKVSINEKAFDIKPSDVDDLNFVALDAHHFHIIKNDKAYKAEVVAADQRTKTFTFKINGTLYTAKVADKYDRLIEQLGMKIQTGGAGGNIKAPMPGLVLDIAVEVGQSVKKGDKVLILEAMKMENIIKATGDGTVAAINTAKGSAVEKGQLLIVIK